MKIIISPAKKMKRCEDILPPLSSPFFLDKTRILLKELQALSYEELKAVLSCGDKIARESFDTFHSMNLEKGTTPAIFAYDGIQYKYMAPQVFERSFLDFAQQHLRILSGFYGLLSPFDGVVPYRLEMQAKLKPSLYDFWNDSLYKELIKDEELIINLASEEYSKVISKYVTSSVSFVTISFSEKVGNRLIEKGVYVKMARGEMVRFMAENNITTIEGLKDFNRLGYSFEPSLSSETKLVFVR